MSATVALLPSLARDHRDTKADEEEVYVWWGKVKSGSTTCSTLVPHCDYLDYYGPTRPLHEAYSMSRDTWSVAEAKAKLSEVIERAARSPQTITRNGRVAAIVVAADEWDRKSRRTGNLAEFFATSPLRESGLKTRRKKGSLRRPDL